MPAFQYKAVDKTGLPARGSLEAANEVDLELRLRRMGLDLITFKEIEKTAAGFGGGGASAGAASAVAVPSVVSVVSSMSSVADVAEADVRIVTGPIISSRTSAYADASVRNSPVLTKSMSSRWVLA